MRSVSTAPNFEASKWLQIYALLDSAELKELFTALGDVALASMGKLVTPDEAFVSLESFLKNYDLYVSALQEGRTPPPEIRQNLTVALSAERQDFVLQKVPNGKGVVRFCKPVILLKEHTLSYSREERKFRSQIHGADSIAWGVEFKYPQLYMDSNSKEIVKTMQEPRNLFKVLQRALRSLSVPVSISGVQTTARIGRRAYIWADSHPAFTSGGFTLDR